MRREDCIINILSTCIYALTPYLRSIFVLNEMRRLHNKYFVYMYLCPDPISEKHMLNEMRRLHNKYFVYMYLCPDPISESILIIINILSTCIYALTNDHF